MKKVCRIVIVSLLFTLILFLFSCPEFNRISEWGEVDIHTPKKNELLHCGDEYLISWELNDADYLSIKLEKGDKFSQMIAQETENDGEFLWSIPSNIRTDKNYKIRITILDGTYKGDTGTSKEFYISKEKWEDLGTVSKKVASGISVALGNDQNPAVIFNESGEGIYRKMHVKKWNKRTWDDFGFFTDHCSFFYSIAVPGDPVDSRDNNLFAVFSAFEVGLFLSKWDSDGWYEYPPPYEINQEEDHWEYTCFAFGLSMAVDNNNNPVITYFRVPWLPENYGDGYDTVLDDIQVCLYVNQLNSKDGTWTYLSGSSAEYPAVIFFDGMMLQPVIDDFWAGREPNLNVCIPVATGPDNNPVIAYLTYNTAIKKLRIIKWNGNSWSGFGDIEFVNDVNEGNADFPSLAIDSNNTPYVVYVNMDSYDIIVKKWNEIEAKWDNLGFNKSVSGIDSDYNPDENAGYVENRRPSIAIGGDNLPVVFSEHGVRKYNDNGEWHFIGFPNLPSKNTGFHNYSIATFDNTTVVAFPDRDNKVKVKMLDLSEY